MVVHLYSQEVFCFKRRVLLDFCSLMVITSECLFLIYFVSFRQSHKVDDKRKYWKVVKVKAFSRGKSLTPTFSHVAVRLASQLTAIPGFFAYDYDTVCAYYQCSCTGWWVFRVAVRNLWSQAVDESFLLSSWRKARSNWTCTVLNWWVLRDIGEKWCEEWYNIPVIHDLTELNEHLAVEIPPSARVYPSDEIID